MPGVEFGFSSPRPKNTPSEAGSQGSSAPQALKSGVERASCVVPICLLMELEPGAEALSERVLGGRGDGGEEHLLSD